MSDIKIGSRVRNVSLTWCSGYYHNPSTGDIKFVPERQDNERDELRSVGYVDCSGGVDVKTMNHKWFGIVMDIQFVKSSPIYLVKWDNGSLCGKMNGQIELSIDEVRDNKLNELGI